MGENEHALHFYWRYRLISMVAWESGLRFEQNLLKMGRFLFLLRAG